MKRRQKTTNRGNENSPVTDNLLCDLNIDFQVPALLRVYFYSLLAGTKVSTVYSRVFLRYRNSSSSTSSLLENPSVMQNRNLKDKQKEIQEILSGTNNDWISGSVYLLDSFSPAFVFWFLPGARRGLTSDYKRFPLPLNIASSPLVSFLRMFLYHKARKRRWRGRVGEVGRRLMHLVPAPAVRLMKRRVQSRPGVRQEN